MQFCFTFTLSFNNKKVTMSTQYTKADLERIVMVQLENLSAIHDLLSIMKVQNELLHNANKKLKDETADFKTKQYQHSARDRK